MPEKRSLRALSDRAQRMERDRVERVVRVMRDKFGVHVDSSHSSTPERTIRSLIPPLRRHTARPSGGEASAGCTSGGRGAESSGEPRECRLDGPSELFGREPALASVASFRARRTSFA